MNLSNFVSHKYHSKMIFVIGLMLSALGREAPKARPTFSKQLTIYSDTYLL